MLTYFCLLFFSLPKGSFVYSDPISLTLNWHHLKNKSLLTHQHPDTRSNRLLGTDYKFKYLPVLLIVIALCVCIYVSPEAVYGEILRSVHSKNQCRVVRASDSATDKLQIN